MKKEYWLVLVCVVIACGTLIAVSLINDNEYVPCNLDLGCYNEEGCETNVSVNQVSYVTVKLDRYDNTHQH